MKEETSVKNMQIEDSESKEIDNLPTDVGQIKEVGVESEKIHKPNKLRSLYSEKYPDAKFATDDEYESAFEEDYRNDSASLKSFKEDNEKIFALMNDNPELGAIMSELAKGTPFVVALAKSVDLASLIPEEGESNYQPYIDATKQRESRRKELDAQRAEFISNQEATQAEASAFFEEQGVSEEDSQGLVDFIDGVIGDLCRGKLDRGTIMKLYQAYKYDEKISEAEEAGRIAGRNERIETKRLKDKASTDGLPDSRGASVSVEPPPNHRKVIDFDSIKNMS